MSKTRLVVPPLRGPGTWLLQPPPPVLALAPTTSANIVRTTRELRTTTDSARGLVRTTREVRVRTHPRTTRRAPLSNIRRRAAVDCAPPPARACYGFPLVPCACSLADTIEVLRALSAVLSIRAASDYYACGEKFRTIHGWFLMSLRGMRSLASLTSSCKRQNIQTQHAQDYLFF
jgi:hypothetical protein